MLTLFMLPLLRPKLLASRCAGRALGSARAPAGARDVVTPSWRETASRDAPVEAGDAVALEPQRETENIRSGYEDKPLIQKGG